MDDEKMGIAFGMVLSITLVILAPSIVTFGVIDSILAIIALVSMLIAWLGDDPIEGRFDRNSHF